MDSKHNVSQMTLPTRPATQNRLWMDAFGKNNTGTIIYIDGSGYSYDAAGANDVAATDYEKLFINGVVLKVGDDYYRATGFVNDALVFGYTPPANENNNN